MSTPFHKLIVRE